MISTDRHFCDDSKIIADLLKICESEPVTIASKNVIRDQDTVVTPEPTTIEVAIPVYVKSASAKLRDCILVHDSVQGIGEIVNVNINDELEGTTWTPLAFASLHGDIPIVTAALSAGAKINGTSSSLRYTALHAAVMNDQADIVKMLLDNGANMLLVNYDGISPRQLAIQWDHQRIMEIFNKTLDDN